MIEIKIDDKGVIENLRKLQQKTQNLSPCMKIIAEIMRTAVIKNFEEGGRPKWKPSARALLQGGKTLVDTGRLMRSVTAHATQDKAVVGTNVKYAPIHQFGGRISPHTVVAKNAKALKIPTKDGIIFRKKANIPGITIPARPFLKLTDKDLEDVRNAILNYLKE